MNPRQEKLLQAAALLDEVRADLNDNATLCAGCGCYRKDNWSEAQLADSLKAAVKKIHRYVELLGTENQKRNAPV